MMAPIRPMSRRRPSPRRCRRPNAAGWHNGPVTITWTVTDPESGVTSATGCEALTVANETGGVTLTCSVTNGAGLAASESVTLKIDLTPPTLTCAVGPAVLGPPNHKLVPVIANVSVADGVSGPGGFTLEGVTSSEADAGLGNGDTPGDIQGFAIGSDDRTGQLRAERSGSGSGRTYRLRYTGADIAGNAASCDAVTLVPHDNGKK